MKLLSIKNYFKGLLEKNTSLMTIYFVIMSGIFFTCGMALTKMVSLSIHSLMILFFRCFFAFIFLLPFTFRSNINVLKTNRFFMHFLRVLFLSLAMFCTYYVYRKIPLTTATAIGFSSPLFTAIFARYFLKEDLTLRQWILICLGYIGILIMLQPFSFKLNSDIFIAILANIFASGAIIVTKELSSTESYTTLLFYSTFATFILSAMAVVGFWEFPPIKDFLFMVAIGVFGLLSSVFYLMALKYGKASLVAPFEYTRIIFAMAIGYSFFYETLNMRIILGIILIALSTLGITKKEVTVST